jgi:glutathione S-transferase
MVKLHREDIKNKALLDWQGVHLFHFQGSSCSQKTRIFLGLKGIDWQSHPVNLAKQDNYTPEFLAINPRGLVPVLVHDGDVHIESNDILEYLDQVFPEPTLIPENKRSELLAGLKQEDDLHLDIRALTMRFVFPKKLAQKNANALASFKSDAGTIEGRIDPHKQVELDFWESYANQGITDEMARTSTLRFKAVYEDFEQRLGQSQYLLGEKLTLLDVAWFIYTNRLIAAGYPFARLHPKVYDWYTGLTSREPFSTESKTPAPLKMITGALHTAQALTGQTLEKVAGI